MLRHSAIGTMLCLSGLLLLSACGGGGGDVNSGTPPVGGSPGGASNGLVINASKSELRFVTVNGRDAADDQITFSLSGAQASATYFAKAESESGSGFNTDIVDSSLNSMTVGLRARTATTSTDGTINFKLCKDEKCGNVVWSRSIPYRVRAYRIDTSEVALSGAEGASVTVIRAITPAAAPGDLAVVNSAPWLAATIDSAGQLAVTASGAGLTKGNYSSFVNVFPANGQYSGAGLPVALNLGAGVVLPADAAITLDSQTPALLNRTMTLAFNGQQAPGWSVNSDKPWLVPVTASGTGATAVSYAIDAAKLASLENFGTDTGKLTFKIAGNPDAVYKVSVTKQLPQLQGALPRQVRAGQLAQIRLRGRGLLQLGSIGAITLDGVAVKTGTIISDTEASLTVSGMAAGAHLFDIVGNGRFAPQTVTAVNASELAAASFDSAGDKGAIIYSTTRNAMYAVDQTNARLLRYVLAEGRWTLDRSTPAVSSARIGLAHDEQTLYTTSGGRTLEERDPDTLAIRASYVYNGMDPYLAGYGGAELPITADGRIWFARGQWSDLLYFDTTTKTFGAAEIPFGSEQYGPVYAVSADGSRMFVYSTTVSIAKALRYDIASGKFAKVVSPIFSNVGTALSGNGKYVLIGATEMYESDNARFVGQLPAGSGGYHKPALVSPDGSLIFAAATKYEFNAASLTGIDVIESASMTKLGTIALPAEVVDCGSDTYFCSRYGVLKLTPFGDAIIWAGNKKIVILPVPKTPGGIGAARFKLAR